MKRRLLIAILFLSTASYAKSEFDRVVNAIETHCGVRRTHIPLLGVANFFVKIVRPAGVSGFKLAVFEDLHTTYREQEELDQFMARLASDDLRPMIRTHSRRSGESSYIFTGDVGKTTRMLIVTFERDEATVVQVDANMEVLMRTINSPGNAHQYLTKGRDSDE